MKGERPSGSLGDSVSDALTEAEIVRGLRLGDRRAWEALCEQFSPRLWRYVARLIGSDDAAVADVFQETFLAVAKSGRNLTANAKLWPWLAGIGHRQAALYWRKAYAARRVGLEVDPVNSSAGDDPLERLLTAEKVELVRCLLAEMNANFVAILTGKYLDGLSVKQLVELMGGSEESIRSKLARARRDFRARYERAVKTSENHQNPGAFELAPKEGDYL